MNPISNPSATFGVSHDLPASSGEGQATSTRGGHFWNPAQLAHRAHDHLLEPAMEAVKNVKDQAGAKIHQAEEALGHKRDETMAWSSAHPCQTMMIGFIVGILSGLLIARRDW